MTLSVFFLSLHSLTQCYCQDPNSRRPMNTACPCYSHGHVLGTWGLVQGSPPPPYRDTVGPDACHSVSAPESGTQLCLIRPQVLQLRKPAYFSGRSLTRAPPGLSGSTKGPQLVPLPTVDISLSSCRAGLALPWRAALVCRITRIDIMPSAAVRLFFVLIQVQTPQK